MGHEISAQQVSRPALPHITKSSRLKTTAGIKGLLAAIESAQKRIIRSITASPQLRYHRPAGAMEALARRRRSISGCTASVATKLYSNSNHTAPATTQYQRMLFCCLSSARQGSCRHCARPSRAPGSRLRNPDVVHKLTRYTICRASARKYKWRRQPDRA